MSDIYNYRTYHDLIFWHQNKFHVSVNMFSGKVSGHLFNEKYRLENVFSNIQFYGLDKTAIGFGDIGYQWAARMVVWCNDDIYNNGERWITCHPDSPLSCEKAPTWIRDFCREINELFENYPNIKRYIRDNDFTTRDNIQQECQRLAGLIAKHQRTYVAPHQNKKMM